MLNIYTRATVNYNTLGSLLLASVINTYLQFSLQPYWDCFEYNAVTIYPLYI